VSSATSISCTTVLVAAAVCWQLLGTWAATV